MMNRDHLARPPSPASPSSESSHESEQDKLDQVEPVTRHDINTLAMALDFIDNKIEQLKKKTIFFDDRMNEEMLATHRLINSNDQYNKTNIRELIQKDKDAQSHHKIMFDNMLTAVEKLYENQRHDNTRANNLEMKLRKKGYLSTQHAIDYVPYINLPDKHKRGAPPPYDPYLGSIPLFPSNSLSHRTRTTIANKYTVL